MHLRHDWGDKDEVESYIHLPSCPTGPRGKRDCLMACDGASGRMIMQTRSGISMLEMYSSCGSCYLIDEIYFTYRLLRERA